VDLLDRYLIELCNYVKPETLVLIPTGAAATEPVHENLLPYLTVPDACECHPKVVGEKKAAGTIVKGAAVGALVEMRAQSSLEALQKAFGTETVALQTLTPSQLRVAFDTFDQNGNGIMSRSELVEGVRTMGLALSKERIEELVEELDPHMQGRITFAEFQEWWQTRIASSPVTFITSEQEWDRILADPFPHVLSLDPRGPLVILEIGFTFCRPCKAFEKKYEAFAKKFPTVRFVRVNGNENGSTVKLCRDRLGVKKTPSFYLFRGQKQIEVWTGANPEKFEATLTQALSDDGLPAESG